MSRIPAALSLDLDDLWTYLRTHGDPGWETHPSYFDVVVPRVLALFGERDLKITFFLVGQDAALPHNRERLASLVAAGHEVGNHSFQHEQWLHLYSEAEVERDLAQAEDAIAGAVGVRPDGFRGPGYSVSPTVLRVLARRGYRYDASTLPTYLGPLARAFYFRTAKLSPEERRRRAVLFGTLKDGVRPVKPYRWQLDDATLLELPVTTTPLVKTPFHVSYLLYLGITSHALAKLYFRCALALCRATRTPPSLLLHPLDFLGGDDCAALAFFPAMALPGALKAARTMEFVNLYRRAFDVRPMGPFADAVLRRGGLRLRRPDFAHLTAAAAPAP